MIQKLATNADAELILHLYELRTEATMRAARKWVIGQFWPRTAEEFFAVSRDLGAEHQGYLRQVTTYWEMAAAFVLHGCLSPELFLDCTGENFFLLAKFEPLLPQIREEAPLFLARTEELVHRYPEASEIYERYRKSAERIRASRS